MGMGYHEPFQRISSRGDKCYQGLCFQRLYMSIFIIPCFHTMFNVILIPGGIAPLMKYMENKSIKQVFLKNSSLKPLKWDPINYVWRLKATLLINIGGAHSFRDKYHFRSIILRLLNLNVKRVVEGGRSGPLSHLKEPWV